VHEGNFINPFTSVRHKCATEYAFMSEKIAQRFIVFIHRACNTTKDCQNSWREWDDVQKINFENAVRSGFTDHTVRHRSISFLRDLGGIVMTLCFVS
jgi:hypothetical protein